MPENFSVSPGSPDELGLVLGEGGGNFALYSETAAAVDFCLFNAADKETLRLRLPGRSGSVFHGFIHGLQEGARYGLRVHGPYDFARGLRYNPAKLLIDPYALELDRCIELHPSMLGFAADGSPSAEDSAAYVAKAVAKKPVLATDAPRRKKRWAETIVYELHVRGFTRLMPEIPENLRGTFAGLAHPASIAALKNLGVNTLELMPCAAWIDERHLPPLGLKNYWGYNPVAFMAPDPRLAPGGWKEVREFVAALQASGFDVLVDVVLNHSGESDELGPTISLRGIDNASLLPADREPRALRQRRWLRQHLALRPSRRHPSRHGQLARLGATRRRRWVPLRSRRHAGAARRRLRSPGSLARGDRAGPGAASSENDCRALGHRPRRLSLRTISAALERMERSFPRRHAKILAGRWRYGRGAGVGAGRLAPTSAKFDRPTKSVNFITAHDGFTLADLVAYERKHNEANGEQNRDGTDCNYSWNNGAEGPTDDEEIRALRRRDQRNLLATLFSARGLPMLAMGAECGHSQNGNNNAYAQDNSLTWLDWGKADQKLIAFTRKLIALRLGEAALHRDAFLTGARLDDSGIPDAQWFSAEGAPMTEVQWRESERRFLGLSLYAENSRVLLLLNAGDAVVFPLPAPREGRVRRWPSTLSSMKPRSAKLAKEGIFWSSRAA